MTNQSLFLTFKHNVFVIKILANTGTMSGKLSVSRNEIDLDLGQVI